MNSPYPASCPPRGQLSRAALGIITSADLFGADVGTCERLRHLPLLARPYRDLAEVADLLDTIPAA
ncbi:hypothetical protein [Actinocrispum wychmicini]|uniref:hypothetical protein n=1 Tax=Actinocrispum wychmicini TaxID=1213861 RepID=UPI001048804E|nr:hypothetical protein [Actinocrispum wychmicini]